MKKFWMLLICFFVTMPLLAQGTMSTDESPASEAEASLSGTTEEEMDLREEEVQMQEEAYDPTIDDRPVTIELQEDPED